MIPACMPRSRGQYLAAIDATGFETDPDLQPTRSNGVLVTHCNQGARKALALLGLVIPPLLANDLAAWFPNEGSALGWRKVLAAEASLRAELGLPTVGVWKNPTGPHGHIVLVVPSIGGTGMHSAQAGAKNWSNAPIEGAGLAAHAYAFYTHD